MLFFREPSGVEVAVSGPAEDASCPSVSPDGDRIAYLARVPENGTELRVMSLSGGQPVTLATGVEPSEYPSWSPDGRFVTFAAGSPIKVWVVSAAGGEPRELTPGGGDYPRWSPDGQWIAYSVWTQDSDPNQGAWVVEADGGTPIKIGDEPTRLVWSTDGGFFGSCGDRKTTSSCGRRIQSSGSGGGVRSWTSVRPAASHLEHLPLTVNPATGELVMNRRTTLANLLVFENMDTRRW